MIAIRGLELSSLFYHHPRGVKHAGRLSFLAAKEAREQKQLVAFYLEQYFIHT